ncbi:hypothetical protein [Salinactinospora qingdaonensis]|uniref:Ig-like domain-containing protein n=1 Tax=Salinactinospora qingdaonensis TaxID=702744 RepID=A0ABP7GDC0_9ACTN
MTTLMPARLGWHVRSALGVALTVAAVATGAAPATAQPSAPSERENTHLRPCRSDDFTIIEDERGAAAGTIYIEFAMIRTGGDSEAATQPCELSDRVDVYWTEEPGGARVGSWAEYSSDTRGRTFVVEPQGMALLTLAQPNPRNYPTRACRPVPVSGIEVFVNVGDGSGSSYAPTGGKDLMCSAQGVGVPRVSVAEWPY